MQQYEKTCYKASRVSEEEMGNFLYKLSLRFFLSGLEWTSHHRSLQSNPQKNTHTSRLKTRFTNYTSGILQLLESSVEISSRLGITCGSLGVSFIISLAEAVLRKWWKRCTRLLVICSMSLSLSFMIKSFCPVKCIIGDGWGQGRGESPVGGGVWRD